MGRPLSSGFPHCKQFCIRYQKNKNPNKIASQFLGFWRFVFILFFQDSLHLKVCANVRHIQMILLLEVCACLFHFLSFIPAHFIIADLVCYTLEKDCIDVLHIPQSYSWELVLISLLSFIPAHSIIATVIHFTHSPQKYCFDVLRIPIDLLRYGLEKTACDVHILFFIPWPDFLS
jgi:hypothetical protein